MAALTDTIEEMKAALRRKLANVASSQLIERLERQLDAGVEGTGALVGALVKVRTVLNLFVGEDLAVQIYRHLTQIGVARGHLSRVNETLF